MAPRLTGSEPDLCAGYTFDPSTPGGGALPPALSRPVSFLTFTRSNPGSRALPRKVAGNPRRLGSHTSVILLHSHC
jgi:hypothetical protein